MKVAVETDVCEVLCESVENIDLVVRRRGQDDLVIRLNLDETPLDLRLREIQS